MKFKNPFIISLVAVTFLLTGAVYAGPKADTSAIKGKKVAACVSCFLKPAATQLADNTVKDTTSAKITKHSGK